LSACKITPGGPECSTTSAYQILSRCGCGESGRQVKAPGQGTRPRTRFQMARAGWLHSIRPSCLAIFGA
jgi:hypothetical protein